MEDVKFGKGSQEEYALNPTPDADKMYIINSGTGTDKKGKLYNGDVMVGSTILDDIVLDKDITVAGVTVGNLVPGTVLPKGTTGTGIWEKALVKELFPTKTDPSLAISGSGCTPAAGTTSEMGTVINGSIAGTFNAGSFNTNGWSTPAEPATGVTAVAQTYNLTVNGAKVVDNGTLAPYAIPTPITIGASVIATANIQNTASKNVPVTNLGNPYPAVNIVAGTKNSNQLTWTGQRKYFVGCKTEIPVDMDSVYVRALSQSALNPIAGTTISVPVTVGTKAVIITYPATLRDLSNVTSQALGGASIKGDFKAQTQVQVEGANGYTAIAYKAFMWSIPAGAAGADTLTVTI